MAILTFAASTDTSASHVQGANADYATARSTGSAQNTTPTTMYVGQEYTGSVYNIHRGILRFDTSSIPDGATITRAYLRLAVYQDDSQVDFDVLIRKQDWSAYVPVNSSNRDAVYDGCLAADTDVTWRNSSGISLNTLYDSPDLDTSWISKTGYTYYSLIGSRDLAAQAPASQDRLRFAGPLYATEALRPVLVVEYSEGADQNLEAPSSGASTVFGQASLVRSLSGLSASSSLLLASLSAPGEVSMASGVAGSSSVSGLLGATSPPGYYLDSVAGDDNNDGTSPDQAWKSMSKIDAVSLQPGDHVYLKRGSSFTYRWTISESGTAQDPIVLTAYGVGDLPVMRWPNTSKLACLILTGSYITVDSIKFADTHLAGIEIYGDHNTIQYCEGEANGALLVNRNGADYTLVQHNYIHDSTMVVNTDDGGTNDYGGNGVWFYGGNYCQILYNTFVNCRAASYDYGYDGGAIELYPSGGMSNLIIHGNYSTGGQGFLETGSGDNSTIANLTLTCNVSDRDYGAFFICRPGGSRPTPPQDWIVANNTIVKNSTLYSYYVFDIIGSADDNPGSDLIVRNNIYYGPVDVCRSGQTDDFVHEYNTYYLISGADLNLTLGTGEDQDNPLFEDLAGGDYHLTASSTMRDSGHPTYVPPIAYDIEGTGLPQNARMDRGAYEYVALGMLASSSGASSASGLVGLALPLASSSTGSSSAQAAINAYLGLASRSAGVCQVQPSMSLMLGIMLGRLTSRLGFRHLLGRGPDKPKLQ